MCTSTNLIPISRCGAVALAPHFRNLSWLTLLALQIGFPVFTHAAEAPGGLTVIVKDQITDLPLAAAQITIAERETGISLTGFFFRFSSLRRNRPNTGPFPSLWGPV